MDEQALTQIKDTLVKNNPNFVKLDDDVYARFNSIRLCYDDGKLKMSLVMNEMTLMEHNYKVDLTTGMTVDFYGLNALIHVDVTG